jgi:hypothetical protein
MEKEERRGLCVDFSDFYRLQICLSPAFVDLADEGT